MFINVMYASKCWSSREFELTQIRFTLCILFILKMLGSPFELIPQITIYYYIEDSDT